MHSASPQPSARLGLVVLAVLLSAGIAGASFFAGHIVSKHDLALSRELNRAERLAHRGVAAMRTWQPDAEAPGATYAEDYGSIFLRLRGEGALVPVERRGAGGGMTTMGGEVLLLTHEGGIFAATGPDDIRRTSIAAPNNGFEDYLRAAESDEYRDYRHVPAVFRYNDLLFAEQGGGGTLFASYTEFDGDETCYRTAIAALAVGVAAAERVEAAADDWSVIYRTKPCLPLKRERRAIEGHVAGGRMTFEAPGTLYLANGDYHWDGIRGPEALSQQPDVDYGKVVAIDLATGTARHVSSGHRNPQGIVLDREGQLWSAEHGPRGGDELNRIVEGANYGWPLETIGTSYDGSPWPPAISYGRHETFAAPTFAWLPAIAPSALTLIEGFDEAWDGDLLLASLADQSLHRIRIVEDRVKFAERIPIGKRLRYVHQHADGRIVMWTDDRYLIFVTVAEDTFLSRVVEDHLAAQDFSEPERARVAEALDGCLQCHVFEALPGDMNAPNLAGVFNAPVASTTFRWYSPALAERSGRWTRENLAAYLADPDGWATGTTMPAQGLDTFQVEALVDLLAVVTDATE